MRFAKFIPALALVLVLGGGTLAHAQTATTTDTTTVTTPGTPNTGAGGDAAKNALILTGTGAVALLGASYLMRSRTR